MHITLVLDTVSVAVPLDASLSLLANTLPGRPARVVSRSFSARYKLSFSKVQRFFRDFITIKTV